MKRLVWAALLVGGVAAAQAPAPRPASAIDATILHAQVLLDRHGFTTGVIDGRNSALFRQALRGFQTARDLPVTGKLDAATKRALNPGMRPATVTLTLSERALAGPYTNPIPKDYADQAKLTTLGYRSALEKLAEMFHTTPATLVALNSRETMLRPGTRVVFPNVLPTSRSYADSWSGDYRQTLANLNVDANQPQADRVVVDKSEGWLRAYAGDKILAQFPATMGSSHDPLPIGEWKIQGVAANPDWQYNPAILRHADKSDSKEIVPPGPNNPVGVVWIDLSKEHYGIHGTPEPDNIGKTESNGCIRLTNWDAARLSLMVKPGTPAIFQP
ncbi:L,D-transpeptidase [Sphingomonas sp. 2R-10]|uniref:L,D-transpeptidase family protein n=1 Tax=Sphingomonas sp. 2R-10 TaxID=3045148 RepID=UPI000F77DEFF|nr:L,D-transpeptidase [Sphingomonas sp. 2R-10]MDJ0277029.1 L,D-transpeptidase [Sphingomonas sp. 2R-10]